MGMEPKFGIFLDTGGGSAMLKKEKAQTSDNKSYIGPYNPSVVSVLALSGREGRSSRNEKGPI